MHLFKDSPGGTGLIRSAMQAQITLVLDNTELKYGSLAPVEQTGSFNRQRNLTEVCGYSVKQKLRFEFLPTESTDHLMRA